MMVVVRPVGHRRKLDQSCYKCPPRGGYRIPPRDRDPSSPSTLSIFLTGLVFGVGYSVFYNQTKNESLLKTKRTTLKNIRSMPKKVPRLSPLPPPKEKNLNSSAQAEEPTLEIEMEGAEPGNSYELEIVEED